MQTAQVRQIIPPTCIGACNKCKTADILTYETRLLSYTDRNSTFALATSELSLGTLLYAVMATSKIWLKLVFA